MSESQILIKCNERIGIESVGHLVNTTESKLTPSMDDSETIMSNKLSSAKISPSICDGRYRREDGPSGSKLPSISPRSSKKRKRGGYKSRLLASGDDSESGEQIGHPSIGDGVPSSILDQQGRKKRQRRRKNRKYKPYNKLSWKERQEQEDKETRRANRVRAQRFANGQPVAPYNTTQFLMEDHNDLKDIDVKQGPAALNPPLIPRQRAPRARDSSFSLDSEDDFYYSSPEDEKEFLTKEFSSAYEDLHAEQLNAQPKTKLVQDILTMEKKVDVLEKELTEVRSNKRRCHSSDDDEPTTSDERVVLYKSEITKLSEENNRLRAENECLRRRCFGDDAELHHTTSTSSIDSDSDSTASSSGSCSSSSSPEGLEPPKQASPVPVPHPDVPDDPPGVGGGGGEDCPPVVEPKSEPDAMQQ